MKTYLLLRNNKEAGPYTAEELISKGLKAYDLVWIEGRSTAWRYPSEIDELKAYAPAVEEQPFDRFYKKTSPAQKTETVITEQPVIKKEKPRYRIAAAWKKIEASPEPVVASVEPAFTSKTATPVNAPSWKEAYSEWKNETPAIINTASPSVTSKKETVELETKYSRSLDEIKERYIENVLQPKQKKSAGFSVNAKQFGEAALIVLVLAFGLWMVFKPESKAENNSLVAKSKEVKQEPKPAEEQQASDEDLNPEQSSEITTIQEEKPLNKAAVKPAEKSTPVYVTVDKKATKATNVLKQQPLQSLPVRYASEKTNGQKFQKPGMSTHTVAGVRNSVKRDAGIVQTSPANTTTPPQPTITEDQKQAVANTATPAILKNTSTKKSVDELVRVEQMSKYAGVVQDVKLNVQNMTGGTLDLVVVDLKYYDKKGFYKKGETLYIKNLPANRDVIIKAPDDLAASNVTYKVGLVSSAQNGISMVAD